MRGITEERLRELQYMDDYGDWYLNTEEVFKECQDLQVSTPAHNPWQPIESAPKDRPVLLYYPSKVTRIVTGQYSTKFQCFFYNDGNFSFVHNPTHWMELPEPPK